MTTKLRAASFQDGAVTTAKIAADAVTNAKIADDAVQTENVASTVNLGRRNIIINGAMQVAQRGTSFTSVAASAYHLDRYRTGMGDTSARFTVTQATAGLNGFAKSLKYDCTTAESSLSNSDARLFVSYRIEGQDVQQLKKGTSDAEKITVSFYVKSTKTGTYILNIVDSDNNRQISKAYTISSSGTWEQKILTFDGDTTGALTNDNNTSLQLNWWLIAGTGHSGGTLATSWQAYAGSSDYEDSAVGNVNLGDNTSNTWEITGIQMEVGSQATPFEHRSFGEELALCQRYFCKTFQYSQAPAQNPTNKLNAISGPAASNSAYDNILQWWMTVKLRAAPTITTFNPYASNANFSSSGSNGPTAGLYSSGENNVSIRDNAGGYQGVNLQIHATADAEL